MDKIVDHLFVFKGGAEIEDFPGNYTDYREYEASKEPEPPKVEKPAESKDWKKENNSGGLTYNEQKEYQKLEREIHNLEKKKEEVQKKFLQDLSPEEITKASMELRKIEDEIEQKTERWFELGDKAAG